MYCHFLVPLTNGSLLTHSERKGTLDKLSLFSGGFANLVILYLVLSHPPVILVDMNKTTVNRQATNKASLLAPTLPVSVATVEQLQERVQSTIRVENQAAGVRAEAVAELRRREGTELTETVLREDGLRSRRRARSEVEAAVELSGLPETSEGLSNGEISYENARIIAGASQRGEIDETELGDAARTQSPDKFAATVRKHEQQRSKDDGMGRLEHQRSQRFAKIKTDPDDGMVVLYGRFDPITGARIETVLSRKMDELWREEGPRNRCTPGQRMADALELLLTRPDGDESGRSRGTRLLLIADYDVITKELGNGRLADGTPLPAQEIRRLACDADVLPAIFRGASQPLDLGRSRRIASPAQRVALIARDRKCVGCGASAAWCQAHHIIPWQPGGPTDLDNMCLLCSRCHHQVHDNGWRVRRTPTGQYSLRPPPTHYGRPPRRRNPYRRRHTTQQRK